MKNNLFRKEALDYLKSGDYGRVMLARPVSVYVTTGILASLFLAVLLGIIFIDYTKKQQIEGVLVPDIGLAKVYAGAPGVINTLFVNRGQQIKKGQPLFSVSTSHYANGGLDSAAGQLTILKRQSSEIQQQVSLEAAKFEDDLTQHEILIEKTQANIQQLKAVLDISKATVELMRSRYEGASKLLSKGSASQSEANAAKLSHMQASQNMELSENELLSLTSTLKELEHNKARLEVQKNIALSKLNISLAELEKQISYKYSEQEYTAFAPVDGQVIEQQGSIGAFIASSVPVFTILPKDAKLQAMLFAPPNAIGFVRPGMDVRISYAAFPSKHYGSYNGTVKNIGRTLMKPSEINSPIDVENHVFPCVVELDSQVVNINKESVSLQPGMELTATVTLGRKSIVSWIISPLLDSARAL